MNMYKNYVFGKEIDEEIYSSNQIKDILNQAWKIKNILYNQNREYIIDVLDDVGNVFKDKNSLYYKMAYEDLLKNVRFSPQMIEQTLNLTYDILNKKELYKRLSLELVLPYAVDSLVDRYGYDGYIRAYPKGVVLHIGAGNVFLGVLDSLVMGLITKNINIVKVSSSGSNFMKIFALAVKEVDKKGILSKSFSILYWQGGKTEIEKEIVKGVDLVMVWGGYDAVESYRKMAPINVDVEGFGPKTSFAVVFEDYMNIEGYDNLALKIVRDCAMWDQGACSNMHTLYVIVKKSNREKVIKKLIEKLAVEFKKFNNSIPIGKLSDDEKVEVTRAREMAKIDEALGDGIIVSSFPDASYTIIYEKNPSYRISPLNRVLYIKAVENINEIKKEVIVYKDYIQTIGIGANIIDRKKIVDEFYGVGGFRFTNIGEMTIGKTGSPHDGRFVLSRLVNWISLEGRSDNTDKIIELVSIAREKSKFYNRYYSKYNPVFTMNDFQKLPLLEKKHILENTPPKSYDLFTSKPVRGIYFASGGSTGEPKYVFYDQHEYEHTIRMLAYAFEAVGLGEGDIIANLFVAGNLWSSWLSVEKAIAYTKATSLPIGSNLPVENIVSYLKQFKANTIIGLPSFLVKLTEYVEMNKIELKVNKIFYGGEYVSDDMINYFRSVYKNCDVKSAGYASSDVGVIGFQCKHTSKGVHHLFTNSQYIEFLDLDTHKPVKIGEVGEIVVTCLNKKKMPIIRYRLGDIGRFILEKCKCGRTEALFEILGRCDDRIHVGGAHIFLGDIQNAIGKIKELSFNFQVVIYKKDARDYLEINVEYKKNVKNINGLSEKLYEAIMENCEDLKESIKLGWIDRPIIKILPPDSIERVKRTGKIKRVIDKRLSVGKRVYHQN